MKALLLCCLLVISGCALAQAPATSAPPSAEVQAIEATKRFWNVYTSVLASGDIEPLATVCERESVAWVNARGNVLADKYDGTLTVTTTFKMSDFRVTYSSQRIVVIHRLEQTLFHASATTKKPVDSEQKLASMRERIFLERFSGKLLVTYWESEVWS